MAVIDKQINYMGLPMNIQRGNPIPLDDTSVWYDKTAMETYAKDGLTAYVGQILSYVDESTGEVTAYIIADTNGTLNEVGSATLGDDISIELDETTGKLSILGVKSAEDGAQLIYKDGKVTWQVPDNTTVSGLQTAVTSHSTSIAQAEKDIDALEAKFDSMGGILNLAATVSEADFITAKDGAYDPDKFDVGDVILITDTNVEYVCVETNGTKSWELLGDAKGITKLEESVKALQENDTTQDGNIQSLTSAVGNKAVTDGEGNTTAATGLYAYADSVAAAKANAAQAAAEQTAADALSPVSAKADSNASAIASTNAEVASVKSTVTEQGSRLSQAETDIDGLQEAIGDVYTKSETYSQDEVDALLGDYAKADDVTKLTTTVDGHTSSINSLQSSVSALSESDADQDAALETINGAIGTTNDDANAEGSIYARIAANKAAAEAAQTQANAGVTNAAAAQSTADAAAEKATANAGEIATLKTSVSEVSKKADDNATEISTIKTTYETVEDANTAHQDLTKSISKNATDIAANTGTLTSHAESIANLTANSATKEELATAKTALIGKDGDAATADTIYGAKQKAIDLDSAMGTRVTAVEGKLANVSNVMDFIGVSTTDPNGENGPTIAEHTGDYQKGDVLIYGAKEFVYSDDNKWHEFGDAEANTTAIGELKQAVGTANDEANATGSLYARVAQNATDISTLGAKVDANAETAAQAVAAEAEARDKAIEDAIAAEETARNDAITTAVADEADARDKAINSSAAALNASIISVDAKYAEQLTWDTF